MITSSQNPDRYRFVERGHGDITADRIEDADLGTVLWIQTSVDGCYIKADRVEEFANGLRSVARKATPVDNFIALARPSDDGHVITVWRDPHPKGHVPVNLTTIRGSVWDPAAADHLLLTTYGYVTAPGSRWQRMDDGRYGIHLIRAEEPKAPKAPTPTPLTPERLAEIRSTLLGDWLAGGWRVRSVPSPDGGRDQSEVYLPATAVIATFPHWAESVAVFLADANEAVPELLAEVERLTKRVAELEKDSAMLAALEAAGVDKWEGYSDALAGEDL